MKSQVFNDTDARVSRLLLAAWLAADRALSSFDGLSPEATERCGEIWDRLAGRYIELGRWTDYARADNAAWLAREGVAVFTLPAPRPVDTLTALSIEAAASDPSNYDPDPSDPYSELDDDDFQFLREDLGASDYQPLVTECTYR